MADPLPQAHWEPDAGAIEHANLTAFMRRQGFDTYEQLHRWSIEDRGGFWESVIETLGIGLTQPPDQTLDLSQGVGQARWLPGALLNVVASCFQAQPDRTAIISSTGGTLSNVSYGELRAGVNGVANGLTARGLEPGDRIAVAMPMTVEAVLAYLGVIAAGGVVVSIADSFAAEEIATRLAISGARTVMTQDHIIRAGKALPMYDKVVAAGAEGAIVVDTGAGKDLRTGDAWWHDTLGDDSTFDPIPAPPDAHTNILFSSGTTGDPKAVPWTHLTPIKAAMDGHFHQDIHHDDVVAWHTNLGWMMGPWLIYASLINGAALALFDDVPTSADYCRFVEEAGVTILGVVPSLVAAWRSSGAVDAADWSNIRLFSSTGEASNSADMAWLMDLAGNKPVIEYCGGTEIGGGYITGTVLQPAVPGAFSTPALGLDVVILDDEGRATDSGELFLVPPSIGLSSELLNRDHDEVYHAGTPFPGLRHHGDHMEALDGGYYRAHGRIDDTMNLGGIKVGSAEIERALDGLEGVEETAAIAVSPPDGGPARLVIYAVLRHTRAGGVGELRRQMQSAIREKLNPLFKVHDVVAIDALPRTESAKVMRRRLRSEYTGVTD